MAYRRAHLLAEMRARRGHGLDGAVTAEPLLVLRGWQGNDPSSHARMVRAIIFGAKQVIRARFARLKPGHCMPSWYRVHLDPKRWHVEAVDGLLRGHSHLHQMPHRHVQCINLPLSAWMLKLPHPLFANGIYLQ